MNSKLGFALTTANQAISIRPIKISKIRATTLISDLALDLM
jgi:hypothetical protein